MTEDRHNTVSKKIAAYLGQNRVNVTKTLIWSSSCKI